MVAAAKWLNKQIVNATDVLHYSPGINKPQDNVLPDLHVSLSAAKNLAA